MNHLECQFTGVKAFNLYYQGWLPDGETGAVLLVNHGVAEHSGRYQKLAHYLAARGYAVYGFDYRGHGRSGGRRGYVEHFSDYIDDLRTFSHLICRRHPEKKVFLFGHSMGATISLAYAVRSQEVLSGLVLSGTAIQFIPHFQDWLAFLLKPVSVLAPDWGIYRIDSSLLSRDGMEVKSYDHDPWVYRGKLTARLTIDLVESIHQLVNQVSIIQIPVLIAHGTADRLSCPAGAQLIYDKVGSKDKTLRFYPGFYHEILSEPDYLQVLSEIEIWLSQRL